MMPLLQLFEACNDASITTAFVDAPAQNSHVFAVREVQTISEASCH